MPAFRCRAFFDTSAGPRSCSFRSSGSSRSCSSCRFFVRTMNRAILTAVLFFAAPRALAIESEPVDPRAVILDGAIRDWSNANFLHLERPQDVVAEGEGWRGPEDASLAFAVNHDDRTLYFAFEVADDYMVRTPRRVEGEDHIE